MSAAGSLSNDKIIQYNVDVYKPLILQCVRGTELLSFIHQITNDERNTLRKTESQHSERKATEDLLELLAEKKNEPGRWTSFIDALIEKGYDFVSKALKGDGIKDNDDQRKIITIFAGRIQNSIKPSEILADLCKENIINDQDREEIQAEENRKGYKAGAIVLIDRIPRRVEQWFDGFLGVLVKNKYGELVNEIDEFYIPKRHGKGRQQGRSSMEVTYTEEEPMEHYASTSGGGICHQGNLSAAPQVIDRRASTSSLDDTEADDISTIAKTYSLTSAGDDGTNELSELGATAAGPFIDMQTDFNQEILNAVGSDIERELGLNETNSLPMNIIDDNMSIVNNNAHPSGLDESDSDEEERVGPIKLKETFELREYQKELADPGVKGHNCVIVAPTGSGKTHVALEIIKEHMKRMRGRRVAKVAFLVEQTALAAQQGLMCKKYLNHKVKIITGEIQRQESYKELSEWMSRNDILVVTAQLLVNAIGAKDVDITQFSLLVFDECHHTSSNHSFNKIMHFYLDQKHSGHDAELPQIVGMTASLGVGGANTKETAVKWVEKILAHLDAEDLATVKINKGQLADHAPVADQKTITYEPRTNNLFERLVAQLMTFIEEYMVKNKYAGYLPDTSILKSPARHGSEQYTQWVSSLWKETAKVSNQEARRFFTCCRTYLECYNNALVIYYDARVKDALTYIEQEVKAINDNIIPDETDSKMKTIYEKSKPSMEGYVQGNENENPKLEILKGALMKAVEENPDLRCIVFVKTRELGKALEAWMKETTELKELRATTFFGSQASVDRGGMTKHQQHDTLKYFRSGKHKVIVATSVAEEGLDITKCNLVIRYEHVSNEISMVQSRGRGRAEDSQYLLVAERGGKAEQKEELNLLREGMMLQAIDIMQEKIQRNKRGFLKNMSDIQKTEKSERELEAANRQQKATQDGQFELRCHKCSEFICMSTDVKKIMGAHHAVLSEDIGDLVSVKKLPEAKFTDRQLQSAVGKITCKNCGWDLGNVSIYHAAQFPIIKIANFLIVDRHGSQTAVKKWKQVPFTVHPLSDADLQKRITSTFKLLDM